MNELPNVKIYLFLNKKYFFTEIIFISRQTVDKKNTTERFCMRILLEMLKLITIYYKNERIRTVDIYM